jgi:transposase-like protein
MGIIQRGGEIRVQQVRDVTGRTIAEFVNQWAGADRRVIYCDEWKPYNILRPRYRHQRGDHSITYVNGDAHVNGVENFWSLLKRGIVGTFHKVTVKHLHRYRDELTFRFNERKNGSIFALVLENCQRRHLTYAELVA